jgi:hypothetical protein
VFCEEAEDLLDPSDDVLSEVSAEEAVDGEVGGAVDYGAEPHNVVEYPGLGANIVRDTMRLKY